MMTLLSPVRRLGLLLIFSGAATGLLAESPAHGQGPPAQVTQNAAGADDAGFVEARRLMQQGRFDEVLVILRELEQKQPAMAKLPREIGVAYYRKGDYGNPTAYLKKALAQKMRKTTKPRNCWDCLTMSGKPAEAIPELERVQTWYPSANVDASYILGIAISRPRRIRRLGSRSRKCSAWVLIPQRAICSRRACCCARILARWRKNTFRKLSAPILNYRWHTTCSASYIYQSKIPEAIEQFQKELEMNPGYAPAYSQSGRTSYRACRNLKKQKSCCNGLSGWIPLLPGHTFSDRQSSQKKGETELAVRALQRALTMDPNNAIPHHLLGQCYRELGGRKMPSGN